MFSMQYMCINALNRLILMTTLHSTFYFITATNQVIYTLSVSSYLCVSVKTV